MNIEELNDAWAKFCEIRTTLQSDDPLFQERRNKLLEHYYFLVFKVAERLNKKIKEVDIDDMTDWGTDGLFHAVNRFDPSLKIKFETYAIHRIRGAILDNIRKVDWVPRLVRQRYSKIQKVKNAIEVDLGRAASDAEIAEKLNMTFDEFIILKNKANPVACMSMHGVRNSDNDENEEIQIEAIQSQEQSANNHVLREELFRKLLGRNFIPLERKIIHMHYYDNMTMKEIADKTGYSESRISQMHAKVIERLKKKVQLNPEYMSGIESILQS